MDKKQLNKDVLAIGSMLSQNQVGRLKFASSSWTKEYKQAIYSQLWGENARKFYELFLHPQKIE